MNTEKNIISSQQIHRVTVIGLAINVFLAVLKIITALFVGSMALFADGIHSLSDMVTDLAVLIGSRLAAKEPDVNHPYGHGWAETFSSIFIAIVLAAAGAGMIYLAGERIAKQEISNIGFTVLIIAVVSIVLKEFSYVLTKRAAIRLSSTMLYANAWHHRSDSLSSIAVAFGAVASLAGFGYADQIATIIVGIMIIMVSLKVFRDSIGQFTERSVDLETKKQIVEIISQNENIRRWHRLRTRTVGRELFMDLHIMVDPALNITEAHDISSALEFQMHEQITRR